ncbi:MAG: nucleotidyltransferase family protein [Eubacterium sp.]|nr:nucleotidyltransferase family protein [Eubacterium sp.]
MNVVGIIAEYNPFHSGHAYQIRRAKELAEADYVVVILSGDFVQRGEPAIFDKYSRTRDALEGGADLVFELPVRYSLSSAGDFAYGGIKSLNELGFVTHVCFGSEQGKIDQFLKIAETLEREDRSRSEFQAELEKRLREGAPYPDARAQALKNIIGETDFDEAFFSMPNNILGIEYCLALRKLDSKITPLTLLRDGQDYRDATNPTMRRYPSSTAIRAGIHTSNTPHLVLNDFSDLICYALRDIIRKDGDLKNNHSAIDSAKDLSLDLFGRIKNELNNFTSVSDLISKVNTRAFTESRIRRCLMQACLHLTETDTSLPYLHLLGLNTRAGHLLRDLRGGEIDEPGKIEEGQPFSIVTRLAADLPRLSERARELYEQDLFAADIYRFVFQRKYRVTLPNEYEQAPVVVDRDITAYDAF